MSPSLSFSVVQFTLDFLEETLNWLHTHVLISLLEGRLEVLIEFSSSFSTEAYEGEMRGRTRRKNNYSDHFYSLEIIWETATSA